MSRQQTLRFHPLVWPLWLLGGVLCVGTNPLHNLLLLLAAAMVTLVCQDDSPVSRAFGFFVRIGLLVIGIRVVLSLVAVGGFTYGETLLGRLPVLGLPWWLGGLSLGGPFTLEMLAFGITGGIRLLALLALFGAFNAIADHYGLLRRLPSFLGGVGLVLTIGLAFVPQTLNQLIAIREAQRVRGHRFRTWRDALPLLVPLVAGGLERSLQLAEAMDSRGYGARRTNIRHGLLEQSGSMLGLLLVALGLFAAFFRSDARPGWALATAGVLVLALVARRVGRSTHRSRYLRERWRVRDFLAMLSSIVLLGIALITRQAMPGAIQYLPLPTAALPSFHVVSIAMIGLLLVPAGIITIMELQTNRSELREPEQAAI